VISVADVGLISVSLKAIGRELHGVPRGWPKEAQQSSDSFTKISMTSMVVHPHNPRILEAEAGGLR
jgi:hypothetical protein